MLLSLVVTLELVDGVTRNLVQGGVREQTRRSVGEEAAGQCSPGWGTSSGPVRGEHQYCGESSQRAGVLEPSKTWPWWRREATEKDRKFAAKRRQPSFTAVSFRDLLDDTPDEAATSLLQVSPVAHKVVAGSHSHASTTSQVTGECLKSGSAKLYSELRASESLQRGDWTLLDLISSSSNQQQVQHEKGETTQVSSLGKAGVICHYSKVASLAYQYPWDKRGPIDRRRINLNDVVATPQNCISSSENNSPVLPKTPLLPDSPKLHDSKLVTNLDALKQRGSSQQTSLLSGVDKGRTKKEPSVWNTQAVGNLSQPSSDLPWPSPLNKEIKRSTSPRESGESSTSVPQGWSPSSSQVLSDSWIAATMVYYANMQYLAHCGTTHGVTLVHSLKVHRPKGSQPEGSKCPAFKQPEGLGPKRFTARRFIGSKVHNSEGLQPEGLIGSKVHSSKVQRLKGLQLSGSGSKVHSSKVHRLKGSQLEGSKAQRFTARRIVSSLGAAPLGLHYTAT
ncbi:hypothetical protein Hamer_G002917 [Homarus americanus]|uniref:Uncharacterized protein n=1 Tax=Homarus americanus TaxID=6706 RepID=A0A8J5JYH8_HOMAM|nr:hypothetical protein Hamer_G002917 [Homarus americanus]